MSPRVSFISKGCTPSRAHGELDLGSDRAAQLVHRLAERHVGDRRVVDGEDQIAGL